MASLKLVVLAGLLVSATAGCGAPEPLESSATLASETRNGGYGVTVGDRLYALDLAMRNVHLAPYDSLTTSARLTASEAEAVRYHLADVASNQVQDIVLAKLAELRARAEGANLFFPVGNLIDTMGQYAWVNHSHLPCLDVHDDDNPYPGKKQVAYRYENTIRFCADFGTLDTANQAAIVVHEIVYATLTAKSSLVDLVGFLFSPAYRDYSAPARLELKRYVEDLQKVSVGLKNFGLVTRVGAIASTLSDAWSGGSPGVRFCFGKATVGGDNGALVERALVWGVPEAAACTASERQGLAGQSRHLVLVAKGGASNVLLSGDDPVGTFDPAGWTLQELCTGASEGACVANVFGEAWSLVAGGGVETIHGAARAGNLARVQWFVAHGVAVDARNEMLETPLLAAVKEGQVSVADWLIHRGADLEALDKFNYRPMPVAFKAHNRPLVGLLAAAGAEVNSQLYLSQVLSSGLGACDVEMARALLRSPTIDVNRGDPLGGAVYQAQYDCAAALIELAGPRLDLKNKPYLGVAAAVDNVALVQLLLTLPNLDPNIDPNVNGQSRPICEAVEHKNLPMLKTLVAVPTLRLDDSECDFLTPFALAFARFAWSEALPVLLDAGSSPDAFVNGTGWGRGRTLSFAATMGRADVVSLLLARGADIEAEAAAGAGSRRPLAEAVRGQQLPTVKQLVEAGALVNPPGAPKDAQPLCIAEAGGKADMIAFLKTSGAVCTL